jgi:diguanylate cyclase (GGDEF)-like protein
MSRLDSSPRTLIVASDATAALAATAVAAAGGTSEVAASPAAAGDRIAAAHFDLLVLGADLSGGNLALCRELRADPGTRALPVLFVSDGDAPLAGALEAGVTDFACVEHGAIVLEQRIRVLWRSCRRYRELQARHDSTTHDPLTGLLTRTLFADRLEQARINASRNGERVAVLHVNIDRFGAINESLGRESGDVLLQRIADRLQTCLRAGDAVTRPGGSEGQSLSRLTGDEFMLVLPGLTSEFEPAVVAARIMDAITKPFEVNATEVFVTASVGIAICPDDARAPADLIRCAQTAVAHAKGQGGNAYMFYSARMNSDAADRLDLAAQLHRGLAASQFELAYQPIFDIDGKRIRSVEALLRWQHPERGLVLPDTFIPIAEETGLILPLGAWVIEQASQQWRAWLDAGIGPVRIALNISPRQFHDTGFIRQVDDVFEGVGVDPAFFQFEFTEGVLMNGGEAALATTTALKERGIGLSVDDFGTGYSSLNYLREFPADVLKIDASFVAGLPENQENASLVAAIVAMAHKLRLAVVAEGVETEAQLRFLRALDCEQVQGFLLGRPVPAADLAERLRGSRDTSSGRNILAFPRRAIS